MNFNILHNAIRFAGIAIIFFLTQMDVLAQFPHTVTIQDASELGYARLPFQSESPYSYTQQIYHASQINHAGDICRISFKKMSTDTVTQHIRISMGHVSRNDFANTGDWESDAALETVFEGDVTFQEGWNEVILDSHFEYDGLQNLLIAVYNDDTSRQVWQSFVTLNQTGAALTVSSATAFNPNAPPSGISCNLQNHIQFTFNTCNAVPITNSIEVTCGALISDPGGDDDYGSDLFVTQIYISEDGQPLVLEFYEFSLSDYDCLYVYDGASTSSPVLGTFMGSSLPPRIEATGQVITLFFTSNGEGVSSGWIAGISCKPCFTVSTALGSPCDGVSLHPFCTDEAPDGLSYPSGTGGYPTVFFGQSYVGCLANINKPAAWYYMRISESGNLLIYLQQFRDSDGSESDVDFACWGPFSASTSADFKNNLCCGRYDLYNGLTSTHRPYNGDHANGDLGGYPVNNMIDCSFSGSGTEWCFIPNAQEGEFYLLLITNYSGLPGVISFNAVETNYTTAETDCSVVSLAGSNSPVCEGDILFLYCANSESGSTVYWEGPNGFTSTDRTPTIYDVVPANSGNYTLYLFLDNGDTVVSTIPVVVNGLPDVNVYAYRDTLCANDTTRLVASGADSYRWNTTEIDTSTILVAPATSTYFQVVGSTNGCASAVGLYVHTYPPVETVVTQFPDPFCHSEINHTIATQVTSGTPPYSYQWDGNAVAIAGDPASAQTNISAAYLCDSLVEVYLVVTDANNCMKRDTTSILIQDIEPPTIDSAVYSAEAICQNGQYSIPDVTELLVAMAHDNCVNSDEITFSQTPAAGTIITEETDVIVSVHDQCNTLEYGIVEITVPDPIIVSIVKITHATCNKDNGSIEINISTSSDHYDVYWNGIENYTDHTAFNLRPGNYTVSVDDGICPIDFPFTINNIQSIKACFTVSPSPPNFINDMLLFIDCSKNATHRRWNFGDGNSSSTQYPGHQYDEVGKYEVSLYVRDDNDCEDSTTLTLDIKNKTSFFVPSAFSPNGDGLNDLFKPEFVEMDKTEFKMLIYDRWGTLIFYTENPDSGWDGTVNGKHTLNGTMFVYIIHYRNHFGKRHVVKGEVTVVR